MARPAGKLVPELYFVNLGVPFRFLTSPAAAEKVFGLISSDFERFCDSGAIFLHFDVVNFVRWPVCRHTESVVCRMSTYTFEGRSGCMSAADIHFADVDILENCMSCQALQNSYGFLKNLQHAGRSTLLAWRRPRGYSLLRLHPPQTE